MNKAFVVSDVTIIDGTGKKPFCGCIGVRNGRIDFVSKGKDMPENVPVLAGHGLFLTPGLFDCHVHLAAPPDPATHEPYWKLATPPSSKTLATLKSALASLEAGFTTVRNCGAVSWNNPEDIAVRDAIAEEIFPGPRILACGGGITMTGGHGDRAFPAGIPKNPEKGFGDRTCDGKDECIKEVRRKIRLGVDFIKIYSTGGVSTPGDGPDSVDFSLEETRAIVEEASRHNKPVATHAQGLDGIRNAVLAGVSTVEHGSWLDEETAKRMAEKKISLVSTMGVFSAILERRGEYPNPESLGKAEKIMEAHARMLQVARAAGVNMAMGSDASMSIRNGDNAKEMRALSRLGVANAEIMAMATKNAALALGIGESAGTIEKGKYADFLLLSENPLDDIGVFERKNSIRAVIREGKIQCLRFADGEKAIAAAFSPGFAARVLADE
ncbi:MAG: amidohydrolase family protein [Thermovirgaceae bacterium]